MSMPILEVGAIAMAKIPNINGHVFQKYFYPQKMTFFRYLINKLSEIQDKLKTKRSKTFIEVKKINL